MRKNKHSYLSGKKVQISGGQPLTTTSNGKIVLYWYWNRACEYDPPWYDQAPLSSHYVTRTHPLGSCGNLHLTKQHIKNKLITGAAVESWW